MQMKAYYSVLAGLGAAALFGIGTPFAKLLLGQTSAWLLAALLYLGAGVGLAAWRVVRGDRVPRMSRAVGIALPPRWRASDDFPVFDARRSAAKRDYVALCGHSISPENEQKRERS
jgi:hypothetical protein